MLTRLTDQQWAQYERDGYLVLGQVVDGAEVRTLQQRIDDIMMGKARVDYDRMLMQLDSETGAYEDAGPQTRGFKKPTLNYRKIQDLEFDPVFLRYMQLPLFRDICARVHGPETPIGCFRAMFMNKPARKGTLLPWHQDRWLALDRDPLITVWTALDPATVANGCVQVIPGSHHTLLNPSHPSAFLSKEQAADLDAHHQPVHIELKAGEVALLHNWLLHRSDTNKTDISRRAFSVCYMDARTVDSSGATYQTIFGPGALKAEELEAALA